MNPKGSALVVGCENTMASTTSLISARILPAASAHHKAHATKHAAAFPTRRQCLLLLTATTALKLSEMPSRAQDIPLFGLRKNLRKVEEQAEEIVKEGFEAADKGIVAAEKGIEAAEKGIEAAEKEVEAELRVSALAQAGAVAVAEVLGVAIASSIVNAILGPEAQKS